MKLYSFNVALEISLEAMNFFCLVLFHINSWGNIDIFFHLYEKEGLVSDLPPMFIDFPLAHREYSKLILGNKR